MAKRKHIDKKIRDKLLVDAMHRCCLCPQHEDITDIHHIEPISEDGPNTEENLMVVCPLCHAKIHRIRTMYNIEQLKMYKDRWVNLCARRLTLEERLREAPGISYLGPSLHNQTPPEENFVGREEYLKTITDWYKDSQVRIGGLIGWGGVGKSALVRKWYDSLEANKIRPDGIFWWGFYRNAYLERFLNELLKYVSGGQVEPETIKSTWEKTERIKEHIGQGAYLIILDGLEQMQEGKSRDEFGKMNHPELAELLHYLAEVQKGLCLITTRYRLKDLDDWGNQGYENRPLIDLSVPDALSMLKKRGVEGSDEEMTEVIKRYKGHALSLTLLAGYLVEDYRGDITKAKEIPPFYSDEAAGGKAHRILLWYAKQLNEAQQAFMKIFSLFRRAVREEDFKGVFRAEMETEMNQALKKMNVFSFKRMVDNLVDRRLITKDRDGTYATHPLIKNYFESIFEKEDKKLCHKRIYEYIGGYAPERAETLEEMQPLFEQVYHGCAAGLYDEVLDKIFKPKLDRGEAYIVNILGAWDTALSVMLNFFQSGDFSRVPKVSKKSDQGWLLNNSGLALLNTGRPKEAEGPLKLAIELCIENNQIAHASAGYQNLFDLQFRTGEVESGLESAKKDLEMAEKAKDERYIWISKAYLGWGLHLLGRMEEAEKNFKEADELCINLTGSRLHSGAGVFYGDFLISIEKINEAFELTKENLEICKSQNWPDDISRCYRCLGAIERIKGDKKQAEEHLKDALEIARKVGMPELEFEALIESARLNLDLGKKEDAIRDAGQVLKICERTGFRFYEPQAEIVLGKAYLAEKEYEKAEANARTAYDKATSMKYRWAEGEAAHLLGETALAREDKKEAQKWLKKAIKCRKEIKDPKVKESERLSKCVVEGAN